MAKTLEHKVAIVTGSSKGIGAAAAKLLGERGASVVVNYSSDEAGAQKVVAAIKDAGGDGIAVQADVSTEAGIDSLFTAAEKAYDRLDILVNNAGIFKFAPLSDLTVEAIAKQFNLNVIGLLLASKRAAERFDDAGGSIVNISSSITHAPIPDSSVYTGTKGAVDAITKALAAELGPKGIRVNAVSPGPTDTEGAQELGIEKSPMGQALIQQTPLGRFGTPDEIAEVIAYLASDSSGWVTGQIIQASGGLILN